MTGRIPKAAEHLSERIKSLILSQGQQPGDRLGSEQDLMGRFGYSRASVREALRMLETEGLVRMRTGVRGGIFVNEPSRDFFGRALRTHLQFGQVTAEEVLELRTELEGVAARMAAQRRTALDLRHIRQSISDLTALAGDSEKAARENIRFHFLIVEAAHNSLFSMLVDALHDTMYAPTLFVSYDPVRVQAAIEFHRRIYEAIRARDQEGAEKILRQHLGSFKKHLEKTKQISMIARRPSFDHAGEQAR